jgi:hypothetical protein
MKNRDLSPRDLVILRRLFSSQRKNRPNSLLVALQRGLVPPEFVSEAREILAGYPYPRTPRTALPARSEYNNPGWDNVVRALEEDR